MAVAKRHLGISVLDAARRRIAWAFDTFPRPYVSFSAGKDSTALLHLVMEEAIRRNQRVGVLFIDWEAQYQLTIEHARRMFDLYADHIDPHWVALPFLTTNACSQFEPEWICWEKGKEERWVRPAPAWAITDYGHYPFYSYAMTFEDFIIDFGRWYAGDQLACCFVGIRTVESLNRWRAIAGHATRFDGVHGTSHIDGPVWNAYPLYDWRTEDIWTYHAKTGKPYNELYDRFHQAGLSIHQMRICEPYGDEQRRGLWLYHLIEPETWGRVVARVAGANNGALYGTESGNVLGNVKITKPEGHTWESFANMLLDSMPPKTADHYKDKIATWMHWYAARNIDIADEIPGDTGSRDMPSWRRICKMLLKNDYWAKTLYFNVNKADSYMKYKRIMEARRARWGIYPKQPGGQSGEA
jgi:predicted phosphoadenosine phosphosulfate sulfurtransferase